MIDPATGWIEIRSVPEVRAELITNQVSLAWLIRYPLPNIITVDRGKDLLAKFKTMMTNDYRILCNSISVRQTQLWKGYTKQTQLWKEYTKLLVTLYIPFKSNKWI